MKDNGMITVKVPKKSKPMTTAEALRHTLEVYSKVKTYENYLEVQIASRKHKEYMKESIKVVVDNKTKNNS